MAEDNKKGQIGFGESLGRNLAGQAASSLLSGSISSLFGSIAQDRATEASKELMQEQYGYQYKNNLNAMSLARKSKEKAGFNINADGSYSPSVNPPQAGQTALGADSSAYINNLARNQVEYNQAALIAEQTKGQQIKNQLDQRELNNLINQDKNYQNVTFDEQTGNFVINMPVIHSKLDFEAIQDVYRWNGERYTISANVSQDKLRQAIADGQLQDSELLQKLLNLEPSKYDQLIAEISRSKAMKELVDSQNATEKERKGLVKAQADTEKERKGLVKAQTDTEKERKDLVHNQAETEKERKDLVVSEKNLNDLEHSISSHSDFATLLGDLKGKDFGYQICAVLSFIVNSVTRFVKKR